MTCYIKALTAVCVCVSGLVEFFFSWVIRRRVMHSAVMVSISTEICGVFFINTACRTDKIQGDMRTVSWSKAALVRERVAL